MEENIENAGERDAGKKSRKLYCEMMELSEMESCDFADETTERERMTEMMTRILRCGSKQDVAQALFTLVEYIHCSN